MASVELSTNVGPELAHERSILVDDQFMGAFMKGHCRLPVFQETDLLQVRGFVYYLQEGVIAAIHSPGVEHIRLHRIVQPAKEPMDDPGRPWRRISGHAEAGCARQAPGCFDDLGVTDACCLGILIRSAADGRPRLACLILRGAYVLAPRTSPGGTAGLFGAFPYAQTVWRTPLEKRCLGKATLPTSSDSRTNASSL